MSMFFRKERQMEVKIGKLTICGWASLAPMAGVADRAMCEICRAHGAAFCVGELASAKGISLHDAHSAAYLSCSDTERPFGPQLFGSDPETMAFAAKKALEFSPDFIDINMGCPAPKVAVNSKGGSALLKDPILAGEIVKAVAEVCGDTPVTVKIRTGWDSEHIVAPSLAEICEAAGAAAITVHGRTRAQMYAPGVDKETVRAVKRSVGIPVIANGDVIDGPSAAEMYEETGCDLVAVGRAAMGDPWVFTRINAYLSEGRILPPPTLSEKLTGLIEQTEKMRRYKGDRTAFLECRKHAAWYMKGLKGAAELRRQSGTVSDEEGLFALCRRAEELQRG